MFIKKITLKNFRQFYGKQEIIFSVDREKNLTLIHAENGVGKTTLINALLWCFYKTLTTKFEDQKLIVSNQALEEDDHEASVEVDFEHNGAKYLVSRKINQEDDSEKFEAFLIEEDGNYKTLSTPTVFVESVLPKEMSRYFFFDGEYAETFSSKNNKKVVRKAVENMLGCNTANRAEEDLKAIHEELKNAKAALIKKHVSEIFQGQIETLEKQIAKAEADIIMLDANIEAADDAVKEITETLKNTKGAKEIQQERDRLEKEKKETEKAKQKIEASKVRWIDGFSAGLLSDKVSKACADIINKSSIKGQLPSKIAEKFVQEILEKKECICGRSFEAGSTEEGKIRELRVEAGTAEMNDRLMEIHKRMGLLKKDKDVACPNFIGIGKKLEELNEKIDDYEAKIKECSAQLKNSDVREIVEREAALDRNNKKINDLKVKKGVLKNRCEEYEDKIKPLRKKRDELLAREGRAKGLEKQINLLDATIKELNTELDKYREESREVIISKVNKILKETARRNYFAKLDEYFNLDMYYGETKQHVAKSSGENQLLSLAFIAALVSFAADRREETEQLLKPGTMAPLMLDSPFGQLDPAYRKSTAEFLPTLARQVVLLVSKTQGDDDVIAVIDKKIGSEYVLISEVRDAQGNKPSDVIQLHGNQITCSLYECEKNRTRIQKVK